MDLVGIVCARRMFALYPSVFDVLQKFGVEDETLMIDWSVLVILARSGPILRTIYEWIVIYY